MQDFWQARFTQNRALAAQRGKEFQLVFIGDSITELMSNAHDTMNRLWGPYHPQEFGISGDETGQVLWRLRNGELGGVSPKVAVLLIGTNNFADNPDNEIYEGIKHIVTELRTRMPSTKILVLGILPRGAMPDNAFRRRVTGVNSLLARDIADNQHVFFTDIGGAFLEPNGVMKMALMPDQLHPSPLGYTAMFEALKPTVDKLLAQ